MKDFIEKHDLLSRLSMVFVKLTQLSMLFSTKNKKRFFLVEFLLIWKKPSILLITTYYLIN